MKTFPAILLNIPSTNYGNDQGPSRGWFSVDGEHSIRVWFQLDADGQETGYFDVTVDGECIGNEFMCAEEAFNVAWAAFEEALNGTFVYDAGDGVRLGACAEVANV